MFLPWKTVGQSALPYWLSRRTVTAFMLQVEFHVLKRRERATHSRLNRLTHRALHATFATAPVISRTSERRGCPPTAELASWD